jgi:hypothetical protein
VSDEPTEPINEGVGDTRRSFVKKMVVGGFAIPAVTTFSAAGINAAYAQTASGSGAVSATTTSAPTTSTTATTTSTTTTTTSTTTTTTTTTTPFPIPG